jgi:hypothetical protein
MSIQNKIILDSRTWWKYNEIYSIRVHYVSADSTSQINLDLYSDTGTIYSGIYVNDTEILIPSGENIRQLDLSSISSAFTAVVFIKVSCQAGEAFSSSFSSSSRSSSSSSSRSSSSRSSSRSSSSSSSSSSYSSSSSSSVASSSSSSTSDLPYFILISPPVPMSENWTQDTNIL